MVDVVAFLKQFIYYDICFLHCYLYEYHKGLSTESHKERKSVSPGYDRHLIAIVTLKEIIRQQVESSVVDQDPTLLI